LKCVEPGARFVLLIRAHIQLEIKFLVEVIEEKLRRFPFIGLPTELYEFFYISIAVLRPSGTERGRINF
jgi:hypothetical protein